MYELNGDIWLVIPALNPGPAKPDYVDDGHIVFVLTLMLPSTGYQSRRARGPLTYITITIDNMLYLWAILAFQMIHRLRLYTTMMMSWRRRSFENLIPTVPFSPVTI